MGNRRRIPWAGGHLNTRVNVDTDTKADITNDAAPAADSRNTPDVATDDIDTDANAVDVADDDTAPDPIDLTNYITRRSSQRYVDAHVRKTYYLRPELYRRLMRLSKTMNVPMSEIVNDALTLFFAELDRAKKEGVKK